jgi:hypothetical protein
MTEPANSRSKFDSISWCSLDSQRALCEMNRHRVAWVGRDRGGAVPIRGIGT